MIELEDYTRHGSGTQYFLSMRAQANFALEQHKLLKAAYMALDHGTQEERLAILSNLETYLKGVKIKDKK